jgi:hypothetical protein
MRIGSVFAVCLAIAPFIAGCVKVRSSYALLSQPRNAQSGDVVMVEEGKPIPQNLHEIALVHAVGIKPDGDESKVKARLEEQARALGCTTVADVHMDRNDGSTAISGLCLAP